MAVDNKALAVVNKITFAVDYKTSAVDNNKTSAVNQGYDITTVNN